MGRNMKSEQLSESLLPMLLMRILQRHESLIMPYILKGMLKNFSVSWVFRLLGWCTFPTVLRFGYLAILTSDVTVAAKLGERDPRGHMDVMKTGEMIRINYACIKSVNK